MSDRGVTPVVGKGLEIVVVLGYVALVSGVVYGSVVPSARATAADAVGERTLVRAADAVETAVPPTGRDVSVTRTVSLPDRIDGHGYRIRFVDGALVLRHPNPVVATRIPLALPGRVVAVRGAWTGTGTARVRVVSTADGLVVVLEATTDG